MNNAALTYTYTATDSWASNAKSYGTTRIVKLVKGNTITAKARYFLEFVRLA
ncbi:MAG: hypothetical protein IKC46_02385 [Lachnospiraceae bacterium]|nr:hypothetical protein [Lachnospiraceae bacterium]